MAQPPRIRYTVFVAATQSAEDAAAPAEHEVTVEWADQLRAETMMERLGITNKMGANLATLWAWCSLTRQGLYADKFPEFKQVCVGVDQHDDTEAPELDPTEGSTP